MEINSENKSKKKRTKHHISNGRIVDGRSNWVSLQELLKTKKEEYTNQTNKTKIVKGNFFGKKKKQARSSQEATNNISAFKFNFGTSNSDMMNENLGQNERNSKMSNEDVTEKVDYINGRRLTDTLAMDCEMVGTGSDGVDSMIARVSIVNSFGECVYDEYVTPKEEITDFRTFVSGIRPSDLEKGKDLFDVQKDVLDIIEGRKLVGHAIQHDFNVLFISHPNKLIRDTSRYKPFRILCGKGTPSLKKLSSIVLGCEIQGGEHSSVEDAQATMLLYLRYKNQWEKDIKYHYKQRKSRR